jgi:hypothetical protein
VRGWPRLLDLDEGDASYFVEVGDFNDHGVRTDLLESKRQQPEEKTWLCSVVAMRSGTTLVEPFQGTAGFGGAVTQGTSLVELGANPGLWDVTASRYSLR